MYVCDLKVCMLSILLSGGVVVVSDMLKFRVCWVYMKYFPLLLLLVLPDLKAREKNNSVDIAENTGYPNTPEY